MFLQLVRIFFDGRRQFRTAELFPFNERDEFGTTLAEHLDFRIHFLDFLFVGPGSHREIRGQESHFFVSGDPFHHMGPFFHADDGEIIPVFDHVGAQYRNGVAGHHQLFDVPPVQPGGHFSHKSLDFFPGPVAVGSTGRIPDENEPFMGHLLLEPLQDRQSPHPGIDDTNGI